MAQLARFEHDFQDDAGNLLAGPCTVSILPEIGTAQPQAFSDYAGAVPLGNPFVNEGGRIAFHMAGGFYRIDVSKPGMTTRTLRYAAIGLAGASDFTLARNAGVWSSIVTYGRGDYVVRNNVGLFISTQNDNLNHAPDSATPASNTYWTYYPGIAGATVEDVLAELGVHSITISTADPSGGVNGDLWFKVQP